MGEIYLITNKVNGKQYVGQTKYTAGRRFKGHLEECHKHTKNYHLYNAMNKYGVDNFELSVLETNVNESDLDDLEKLYIEQLDTFHTGYNNTKGGGGIRGYKHTEETKKKVGEAVIKNADRIFTDERNRKISFANKGKVFSDAHRKKISEKAKKRVGDKNPFYGKHHSEETKKHWHEVLVTPVIQSTLDGCVVNEFDCVESGAKWCIVNGKTKAKLSSVMYAIYQCCGGARGCSYGYKWNYKRCNDYPSGSRVEDELPPEVHSNLND